MASSAPKFGTCYCGCGDDTNGHFSKEGGHDAPATAMLRFIKYRTTDIAEILRREGFGPDGLNLTEVAQEAGWGA
jgi:hypothetical protein